MNHLLLGKKPLTTKPRRPAHPGAIPSPKVKRPNVKEEKVAKKTPPATHYACPQPEVVPPSELKKHKKRHRKRSPSVEHQKGGDSSSSTETGGHNGNDTEGASDIDDLPTDRVPEITVDSHEELDEEVSMINHMKYSHSSNDILQPIHEKMEATKIRSEPDLFKIGSEDSTDKKFLEELLEEFDKSSLSYESEDPETEDKNEKALQIIKENSEILERLLNKKTTPCNPDQLEPLSKPANHQVQQVQPNKRRISHTSSNGSSAGSVKSNITLQSNPATKPITFNPFPNSARANRKPKEVGRKLGLYK